jgi:hypothetical protein
LRGTVSAPLTLRRLLTTGYRGLLDRFDTITKLELDQIS